jgi:acetyl-CoA carboxylase biotin carboxyl carrier protein
MTIEEIRAIIQVMLESGVAELEVQRGDNRVRVRRSSSQQQEITLPALTSLAPVLMPAATAAAPPVNSTSAAPAALPEPQVSTVKSPIVGTFYESPSPGSPPFVKVGDSVSTGQVLCIIESMKLMNEIEADAPGVIVSRLVQNGSPVEYGQALFTYRPL